jgi:microcystin-dependent protein
MAQIQKGDTFSDGQLVTAARLNALVEAAILNPNAITDQALITTSDLADTLLVYQASTSALKKITLDNLITSTDLGVITVTQIFGTTNLSILTGSGNVSVAGYNNTNIGNSSATSGDTNIYSYNDINLDCSTGEVAITANTTITGNLTINGSNNIMPIGTVMMFAMASVPVGWSKCNGAAVSRTSATYAGLFAVIGTTYGSGDGVNTFNLPDLRGEFVRGWDDGRGVDTGRAIGTSQDQQLEKHKHIASNNDCASYSSVNGVGTGTYNTWCDSGGIVTNNAAALTGDGSHTEQTAKLGTETRPRNVAMMYCIKL